ncbi:SDR family NAD(P)-dependent oxidoreductase [Lentzea guizhouensis]|uniref:SDR family NAD(P)-dependent oxidoreductase n=1 Tax=Lentzea guizhouensis TaxID=1586287 RepID=UPI001C54F9C8|nr:SDR family oxidoreductase [Lentzea guizhouensis]
MAGKVVLVTGGSAGIGRLTARRLARAGAHVVICGRDQDRLDAALAEMPDAVGIRCDVTDPADRELLVRAVVERFGRIDALVNNAGQGRVAKLAELSAEQARSLVDVNFTAVVELTRLVLPLFGSRGGQVVMMSSIGAWVPVPPLSLYSATKAGVLGLAVGLRREVPRGVKVHAVCPGPIRTEWLSRDLNGRPTEQAAPHRLSAGSDPEHVARAVERCLTARTSRTVAAPRWWEIARLGSFAPVSRVLDVVVAPASTAIVRLARRYGRHLGSSS